MISRKYKLIYVHINKTGGTSIESIFGGRLDDQITASQMKEKLGAELWDQCFKFATVRNPWDRMVSEYHFRQTSHLINPSKWHCPKHLRIAPDVSFREWILQGHDEVGSEYIRFRSQLNWLLDKEGNLLVDFIGRFESLEKDFNKVCEITNEQWKLPHFNKTHHTHYSFYYDEETKQIVAERHKEDIEFFNYEFQMNEVLLL